MYVKQREKNTLKASVFRAQNWKSIHAVLEQQID